MRGIKAAWNFEYELSLLRKLLLYFEDLVTK
jgi:hypothetical protein